MKKMSKKVTAVFLAFVMVFAGFPLGISANNNDGGYSGEPVAVYSENIEGAKDDYCEETEAEECFDVLMQEAYDELLLFLDNFDFIVAYEFDDEGNVSVEWDIVALSTASVEDLEQALDELEAAIRGFKAARHFKAAERHVLEVPSDRIAVYHLSEIDIEGITTVVGIPGIQPFTGTGASAGTSSIEANGVIRIVTGTTANAGRQGLDVVPGQFEVPGLQVGDEIEIIIELVELLTTAQNNGFRLEATPGSNTAFAGSSTAIAVGEYETLTATVNQAFINGNSGGSPPTNPPRFRINGNFTAGGAGAPGQAGGVIFIIHDILIHRADSTIATVVFDVDGEGGAIFATVDGEEIESGDTVDVGEDVLFTASPDDGYTVTNWKLGGEIIPGETGLELTLEVPAGGLNVTVTFEQIVFSATLEPDEIDFGEHVVGYDTVNQQSLTIKNTGNSTITGLQATIVGENPEAFVLREPTLGLTLAPGLQGEASFAVAPADDLPAGDYTATVEVRSAENQLEEPLTATLKFSVVEGPSEPVFVDATLPPGTAGESYAQPLLTQGTLPITWAVDPLYLPPGISLNEQGILEGTPILAKNYTFTVTAENEATTAPVSRTFSLTIGPAAVMHTIEFESPITATVGTPPVDIESGAGVANNTQVVFTAGNPPEGHSLPVVAWRVNGDPVTTGISGEGNTRLTMNIAGNSNVTVEFTSDTVTHQVTWGDNITARIGSNNLTSPATVDNNSTVVFTASPPAGFIMPVVAWRIGTTEVTSGVSGTNNETFTRVVNAPMEIVTVEFTPAPNTHQVTWGANITAIIGTTNLTSPATVNNNDTVIFTASPPQGFTFPVVAWRIGTAEVTSGVSGTNNETFTRVVNAPMEIVTVEFTQQGGVPLGNVSGSGTLSEFDAILIARYLSGHQNLNQLPGAENFNIANGRVTQGSVDAGQVRIVDAIMILRRLAGHDVSGLSLFPAP